MTPTNPHPIAERLLRLAERCEAATGPDRELDALIRCAVFASPEAFVEQSPFNGEWCIYEVGYSGKKRGWEPRGLSAEARSGRLTASLDAAKTLVPERCWVRMDEWPREFCAPVASVQPIREPKVEAHVGTGDTLPLALCAAALRAQATDTPTRNGGEA